MTSSLKGKEKKDIKLIADLIRFLDLLKNKEGKSIYDDRTFINILDLHVVKEIS